MQNTHSNKLKTVYAIFALALLILFTIFSITKVHHDCTGDDCLICYVIQTAENNIKLIEVIGALICAITALLYFKEEFKYHINYKSPFFQTLITQKIRLNN